MSFQTRWSTTSPTGTYSSGTQSIWWTCPPSPPKLHPQQTSPWPASSRAGYTSPSLPRRWDINLQLSNSFTWGSRKREGSLLLHDWVQVAFIVKKRYYIAPRLIFFFIYNHEGFLNLSESKVNLENWEKYNAVPKAIGQYSYIPHAIRCFLKIELQSLYWVCFVFSHFSCFWPLVNWFCLKKTWNLSPDQR